MLEILPLTDKLRLKISRYGLDKKVAKAMIFLMSNPFHPGLHTEILEPRSNRLYSFRLDQKYRAIFIVHSNGRTVQIIAVTNHYK